MSATAPASTGGHRAFINARLGSLLAIAPLGVWVVIHLWHNLAVLWGPEAWQEAVTGYPNTGAMLLSSFVVFAPLALHVIWGSRRLVISRPNNWSYGFFDNFKYLLQRLSAVGVLLFLAAHVWLAFLHPRIVEGHAERFADFAHEMRHNVPTLLVYLLGTLGVAYHLAYGVTTFAMTWGLCSSRAALHRVERLSIGIFVLLLAMSWAATFTIWAAG
jgi:succinate dehydrogenase / fumarate reductase cytochrome b subunit